MQQRRSQPTYREGRYPPRRPAAPPRPARSIPPNRDRLYLAATIAILGLSLVAFAALVVAGADSLGGGDGGDPPRQSGAFDQPPPATATAPVGVIPTPGPEPSPTATPAPGEGVGEDVAQGEDGRGGARRPVVCLDVGHGGIDLGKVRENADGTAIVAMEKDLVLAQALELEERLSSQGIDVVLTRRTDTEVNATFADVNGDGETANDVNGDGEIDWRLGEYPDELDELQARVDVCNEAGADLLLSIHINGADNTGLRGYEAWYAEDDALAYVDESAEIAALVVEALGEEFAEAGYETVNRGAAPDSMLFLPDEDVGTFDHLVMLSPDVPERNYVGARMPAVVVECLFISNDDDFVFLTDDPELAQDAIVSAYERALLAFFEDELAAVSEGDGGDEAREGGADGTAEARPTRVPEAEGEADASTPSPAAGRRPEPLPDNGETAQVHYFGDSGRKEIALTFDLGSDRGYTEQILDFLAEKGIRASFGVTGRWAEENPVLVQRIVDDGHMLINHTYSHSSFTGDSPGTEPLTREERIEEIERTHQIILDLTGYDMRPYFRLTYGDGATDPRVMDDIYATGYYLVIMWTCDSNGWNQWSPADIIQYCGQEQPGGIILMHVGSDGTDQDALPGLVEEYERQGFSFVTVEEILQP